MEQRRVNQSRFFKELGSMNDETFEAIEGVTMTFILDYMDGAWHYRKRTTLYLYPNGCYVSHLNDIDEMAWNGERSKEHLTIKHCGVWGYNGDEIILKGLGFETKICEEW